MLFKASTAENLVAEPERGMKDVFDFTVKFFQVEYSREIEQPTPGTLLHESAKKHRQAGVILLIRTAVLSQP